MNALGGYYQKKAHSHRYGEDQDQVCNGGDLLGQYLEVGLGYGGENAQQKVDEHRDKCPLTLADHIAYALSHGEHGHIHPEGK